MSPINKKNDTALTLRSEVDKTAHSSFLTIKKKYSYMRENEVI